MQATKLADFQLPPDVQAAADNAKGQGQVQGKVRSLALGCACPPPPSPGFRASCIRLLLSEPFAATETSTTYLNLSSFLPRDLQGGKQVADSPPSGGTDGTRGRQQDNGQDNMIVLPTGEGWLPCHTARPVISACVAAGKPEFAKHGAFLPLPPATPKTPPTRLHPLTPARPSAPSAHALQASSLT